MTNKKALRPKPKDANSFRISKIVVRLPFVIGFFRRKAPFPPVSPQLVAAILIEVNGP